MLLCFEFEEHGIYLCNVEKSVEDPVNRERNDRSESSDDVKDKNLS